MRRAVPALLLLVAPCLAGAQVATQAMTPLASVEPPPRAPAPRDESRPRLVPAMAHGTAEKTIADLLPQVVLEGGYYSGFFEVVSGVHCDRRSGEILVADKGANAIEIFSETGVPLFAFADDEHLSGPIRIAVDREDRIHVIDSDHTRIKVFDYRGEFLSYLVPPGFEGRTVAITAMTFDENGDLYLGESASGQVLVYDAKLRPKFRIGTFGEGQEQFSTIVGIAVDASSIYVASQRGIAVQVFSRQGRLLRGWGYHDAGLHNVSLPAGIAVDAAGRIILLDTLRQEIKYYDPEGALIGLFAGLGRHPGAVAYPTDLSMDRRGRLCVADGGNRRAQVLMPVDKVPTGGARDRKRQREAVRSAPTPVSAR